MIIEFVESIFLYDVYHMSIKFKEDPYDRSTIMTKECLSQRTCFISMLKKISKLCRDPGRKYFILNRSLLSVIYVYKSSELSECVIVLFKANSAILQLYHGENMLIFNEMMIRFTLY